MPFRDFGESDESDFDSRLESIIGELRTRGYDVRPRKRRTADQQRDLYEYGRSSEKPGPIRTEFSGEPGRESLHQSGTAADLDFFDEGKGLIRDGSYKGFKEAGELGEKWGLEWGGRWKKERPDDVGPDPSHLQLADLRRLRKKREGDTGNLGTASPTARVEEKLADVEDLSTDIKGSVPMSFREAITPKRRRTQDIELPDENVRTFGQGIRGILGGRMSDINLPDERKPYGPEEYVDDRKPYGPEEAPKFSLDPRYSDAPPKTRRLGTLPNLPDIDRSKFDTNPSPMEFGMSAKRGNINLPTQDHTKYDLPDTKLSDLDENVFKDPNREIRESKDMQPIPGMKGSPRYWVVTNPRTGEDYNWFRDTPPTQEEAEQFITDKLHKSFWQKIEDPLTEYPSKKIRELTGGPTLDPRHPLAGIQRWSQPKGDETSNVVRDITEAGGDVMSAMTSPTSVASTAATLGAGAAANAGWGVTSGALNVADKALSGYQAGHGLYRGGKGLYEGDWGQAGAGALEAAFGIYGLSQPAPKIRGPEPPTVDIRGSVYGSRPSPGGFLDTEVIDAPGTRVHPFERGLGAAEPRRLTDANIQEGEIIPDEVPYGPPQLSGQVKGTAQQAGQRVEPPSGRTFYAGKYGTGTDLGTVETTFKTPDIPDIEGAPGVPPVKKGGAMRNPTSGMSRFSDEELARSAQLGDTAAQLEIRVRAKKAAELRRAASEAEASGGTLEDIGAPPGLAEKLRESLKKMTGKTGLEKETQKNLQNLVDLGDKEAAREMARRQAKGRWTGETGAVGRGTRMARLEQRKARLQEDLELASGDARKALAQRGLDDVERDIAAETQSLNNRKKMSLRSSITRYKNAINKAYNEHNMGKVNTLQKQMAGVEAELENVGKTMTKAGNVANPDDNEIVALFRENLHAAQGFPDTRFILPDGLKVTHYDAIHDSAARSIGTDLDEALANGVVRYANSGAEIGGPITSKQAEELVTAPYYNDWGTLTIDVRKAGGRYYEHTEIPRGHDPEKLRQWVKNIYENEPATMPAKDNLKRVGLPEGLVDRYTSQEAEDVVQGLTRTGLPMHEMGDYVETMAMRAHGRIADEGLSVADAAREVVREIPGDQISKVTSEGEAVRNQLMDVIEDIIQFGRNMRAGGERGATNLDFLTGGMFSRKGKTARPANTSQRQGFFNPAKGTIFETEFAKWVNKKSAARVEAVLKAGEFKDLKDLGKDGVKAYANGSRTGRLRDVANFFSEKWDAMEKAGVSPSGARHLTEIFEDSPEEITKAYNKMGRKTQYTFDTMLKEIKKGTDAGLTPKFESIPHMIEWYGEKVDRMIANKTARTLFKNKGWVKMKGEGGVDWKDIPNTLFPPTNVGGQQRSWVASPEFATLINNHLGDEAKFPKFLGDVASTTKNLSLSAGVPTTGINAHGANIMARSLMANLTSNPKRILQHGHYMLSPKTAAQDLGKMRPRMVEAAEDGLSLTTEGYTFGKTGGSGELLRGMGVKEGGWIDRAVTKTGEWFEDPLFQNIIPSIKMKHWADMKDDLIKQGMAKANAGKQAADFTNELYGGVNWQAMGRSKDMQNIGRAAILAPDWLETNFRLGKGVAQSLRNPKSPEGKKYQMLIASLGASYVAANMVNLATTGHLMVQNDPGHTLDIELGTAFGSGGKKKRWIRPFGTAADFVRLPADAAAAALGISGKGGHDIGQTFEIAKNRASIPGAVSMNLMSKRDRFGRPILGQDDYGRPIPLTTQGLNLGLEASSMITPPYVKGGIDWARGKVGGEEALLGGFEIAPFRYSSAGKRPSLGSRTRSNRSSR